MKNVAIKAGSTYGGDTATAVVPAGGPLDGSIVRIPQGCATQSQRAISDSNLFADNACSSHDAATLAFKSAMRLDALESGLSREQLCDGLRADGMVTTPHALEGYMSPTNRMRFPGPWVRRWTELTGSRRLIELTMSEPDRHALKIGRTFIETLTLARTA